MNLTYLFILLLFSAMINCCLYKILSGRLSIAKGDLGNFQGRCGQLQTKNQELKNRNSYLEKEANQTMQIFDITKDICKFLDQDVLFSYFKNQVGNYLTAGDLSFIEGESLPDDYKGFVRVPLEIDNRVIGYLVARQIAQDDWDKFFILSREFIMGLKRILLYKEVQALAITDSLTGISGRRHFLERAEEEVQRSNKFKSVFSLLIVDVDDFKSYNDKYGHLVGDAILKQISQMVKVNLRQIDLVCRYGGDEFLAVLSEIASSEAETVAERIRKTIESTKIKAYDEFLDVTVSIGVSVFPKDSRLLSRLIERADQALYQVKTAGRNKVKIYC